MNRGVHRVLVALAAFALAATAAVAADDSGIIFPRASGSSTGAAAAPVGGSLGSVTLIVGLVLAAVGAWLVWRGRMASPAGREGRQLTIGETRSLGNRQYLVVASFEDKKFLLGVCPGRIDLLAPLHDSSPAERPRA